MEKYSTFDTEKLGGWNFSKTFCQFTLVICAWSGNWGDVCCYLLRKEYFFQVEWCICSNQIFTLKRLYVTLTPFVLPKRPVEILLDIYVASRWFNPFLLQILYFICTAFYPQKMGNSIFQTCDVNAWTSQASFMTYNQITMWFVAWF